MFGIKIKSLLLNNKVYLGLVVLISLIITSPFGEYAVNDDWAYAKSVKLLHEQGVFSIGFWPAMSLLSHVLWGTLFVKVFGFSFIVLRVSGIILSYILLCFTEHFIFKLTSSRWLSLAAALCLYFNPLFFHLSNTFMTDISFLFASCCAIYCYYYYITKKRPFYLLGIAFFCIMAMFTRQLAIILPIAFMASELLLLFTAKERWKRSLFFVGLLAICLVSLYWFEYQFVQQDPEATAYVGLFFSRSPKLNPSFSQWFESLKSKVSLCLLYTGLLLFPLLIFQVLSILKKFLQSKLVITLPLFALLFWPVLFANHIFPIGNTLYNCGLGPITSIELQLPELMASTRTSWFNLVISCASYIGIILFYLQILSKAKTFPRYSKALLQTHHFIITLLFILGGYLILLATATSFFDRYTLFFSCVCMLFLFYFTPNLNFKNCLLPLCLIAYFSIFSTKDYFNYRTKNEVAIATLKNRFHATDGQIHGGFEQLCWNTRWEYWSDKYKEYVICSHALPGYDILKRKIYRRYIPYKMDTLYTLKKRADFTAPKN